MWKSPQNQCFSLLIFLIIAFFLQAHPCFAAFTIDDEKNLGREFYEKLDSNNLLLKHKRLNDYVATVGRLILSKSNQAPFDYTFSIFDSAAINAFATPGGYIYVNRGLISEVENEAQLAGVLAHEIAHANARHIASMIEKSRKLNIAALIGLLAGAFLGGGTDAGAAVAAFSIAGVSAVSLKYSRDHEEEADRLGMTYLVSAGYYPESMVEFLKIMKQYEFVSRSIPSYLLTHPGTEDRIFYLDGLISSRYPISGASDIVGSFIRMQSLIPMDVLQLRKRLVRLDAMRRKDPNNPDLLFAQALAYEQLGQTQPAMDLLKKGLQVAPNDQDLSARAGLLALKTGNPEQARKYLQTAHRNNSTDSELTFALGQANFALASYEKALELYRSLQYRANAPSDLDYHLALAYGKLDRWGEAHYHFGLHFQSQNKLESALSHYRRALTYYPAGSPRAEAIEQAIHELSLGKPSRFGEPARR